MGGLFGKSKAEPAPVANTNTSTKKVSVNEHEMILAKIKIFEDKVEAKLKKLDSQNAALHNKIMSAVAAKNKEQAYFLLKQKKSVVDTKKSTEKRMEALQSQINTIESMIEEANFTDLIKQGNRAIENLSKDIDLEEIALAKQLQEEGRMRREEIDSLLAEDSDNQDLLDELNKIAILSNS